MKGYAKFVLALGTLSFLTLGTAQVQAAPTLLGDYYKAPQSHPDMQNGIDGGVRTGLVETVLGPNGLPVVTPYGKAYAGASGPITDYDAITNEILWWSTAGQGIVYEKSQVDSVPLDIPSNFFPDGQNGNTPYFRTVRWQGTFDLASDGIATFALAADDDAFLYIDNQLVIDNGGVKALTAAPNVTTNLTAGTHKVDLFFSDRHTTQSGIRFSSDMELIPVNPVPEPGTIALLGLGLPALLAFRRRA